MYNSLIPGINNVRRSMPVSVIILQLLGASTTTFGWVFGGFASFFLYFFPLTGWFSIFPGIIPLLFIGIGLAFITFGVWRGIKGLRLLWRGTLTPARLVSILDTGVRSGNNPMWQLTFQFADPQGRWYEIYDLTETLPAQALEHVDLLMVRTPGTEVMPDDEEEPTDAQEKEPVDITHETLTEQQSKENFMQAFFKRKPRQLGDWEVAKVEDGIPVVEEPLLYNPANPLDAVAASCLNGEITVTSDGRIHAGKFAYGYLLPPIIVIGLHVLIYCWQHGLLQGR